MEREIIRIDEEACTGCGLCVPNCPEGAIQIIDGKARLVSDLMCDGLGACLGHCPEGAITIEKREADEYNEKRVMENIVRAGDNTIKAHLKHLREHGEEGYLKDAVEYLRENNIPLPEQEEESKTRATGCLGAQNMEFRKEKGPGNPDQKPRESGISQWPVQMHLISPESEQFYKSDFILIADCTAYAMGNLHEDYIAGKKIGIACPKLDSGTNVYKKKTRALIDDAEINTLTVITMQVPCCSGLLKLAVDAAEEAERKVPVKHIAVSIKGDVLKDEWV
ncbi:MAG: ATP-binding protein [Chitinivibrionales bacterium]